MNITSLTAEIEALAQPALDRAVFEDLFCYDGEPLAFSTTSELAESVVAELYAQQLIASADLSMEVASAGPPRLRHHCKLSRPFVGTGVNDRMHFEAFGDSIPVAICRAALLLCRGIVSSL